MPTREDGDRRNRRLLTAGEVVAATSGVLTAGDPRLPIAGFSIDSRTAQPGDLFFALKGERFDGHRFVAQVLANGAAGAVVSEAASAPDGAVLIQVRDTLAALQALALHVRRQASARVVAITGSAGKTTTKEATAAFLAARYRVMRNRGNLNNHIGLPLSLLDLRHEPEIAVVELGMNHPGEITRLVEIAEPDVRVWTNVAEVHSAFFPTLEDIADAKAEIFHLSGPDSLLVANADDRLVMARARLFPGRVITFGIDAPADVRATHLDTLGIEGVRARLQTPAGDAEMRLPLLGAPNVANVLAASAVALHFEVPLGAIVDRARTLTTAPHRGALVQLARGVTVIDDSYNSNPSALEAMLQVVAVEARRRRTVAVIGEMLELGTRGVGLHRACGRAAAAAGVQVLVTVGGEPARTLGEAAVEGGLPRAAVIHASTSAEAAERVLAVVEAGDLVFVKGSRGVRTDLVVERLAAERA